MTITTTPAAEVEHALDGLRILQQLCHDGARAKGFHVEGDAHRAVAADPFANPVAAQLGLRNHYLNRISQVSDEVSEGREQLRSGRAVDETWYAESPGGIAEFERRKPEGVPSELADVVIRTLDLAAEAGIDLAAMIAEKLAYNATRPTLHGRKF